jgi:hypothetical protein
MEMLDKNEAWDLVELSTTNDDPRTVREAVDSENGNIANFKVIEIVDDNQPYPPLMGLEWAFDYQVIINMKRREMIFEIGYLKFIVSLDPTEGKRYIEPTKGNEIDNLYNMTVRMDDYVNPNVDGALSWKSIISCVSDSEERHEHWQLRMHEHYSISALDCNRVM